MAEKSKTTVDEARDRGVQQVLQRARRGKAALDALIGDTADAGPEPVRAAAAADDTLEAVSGAIEVNDSPEPTRAATEANDNPEAVSGASELNGAPEAIEADAAAGLTPELVQFLVVYLVVGAGKRGKTTIARYIAERAADLGNPLVLIDLEGVNPGLRCSHPECTFPDYDINTGYELAEYLYPHLEMMQTHGQSLLIDFEGNDSRIVDLCKESEFLAILEAYGVHLSIVAVTGGGSDDLVLVQNLLSALGPGSHTLLTVVSERLLPASQRRKEAVIEVLEEAEEVRTLLNQDGSDVVFVPACDLIKKMDYCPLTFREATADFSLGGHNPLRTHERSMLKKKFLEEVDKRFEGKLPCLS